MGLNKLIVKRRGHIEEFDIRKLERSVYCACVNIHMSKKQANQVVAEVVQKLRFFFRNTADVSTLDIKDKVIHFLEEMQHSDVAVMYKHHMNVC